jgi:hypothetical protein
MALYGPKIQWSPGPYFYKGTLTYILQGPPGPDLPAPLATIQATTWSAIMNGHFGLFFTGTSPIFPSAPLADNCKGLLATTETIASTEAKNTKIKMIYNVLSKNIFIKIKMYFM